MITLVLLGGRRPGGVLSEGRSGFLGLLDVFTHVGRGPWCSRGPCRAPVPAIFRWETACAGTIFGPAWTGVGIQALHSRMVRIAMGCRERYRPGGHGGTRVFLGAPQTALHMSFVHHPIRI